MNGALHHPPHDPLRRRLALAATALALAGCAQPPAAPVPAPGRWSGRLALQVDEHLAHPAQSFSASFDLQGSALQGQLRLYTPLGTVLALLEWEDGEARLQQGGQLRSAPSLPQLVAELTGAELPVTALFAWLAGEHTTATGWQADLSGLAQGRLRAERHSPAPHATLRIVLD